MTIWVRIRIRIRVTVMIMVEVRVTIMVRLRIRVEIAIVVTVRGRDRKAPAGTVAESYRGAWWSRYVILMGQYQDTWTLRLFDLGLSLKLDSTWTHLCGHLTDIDSCFSSCNVHVEPMTDAQWCSSAAVVEDELS